MAFGRLRVDELETSTQVVSVDALASSGVSDGDKGDISVSGAGTVWTIDDGAVDTAALGGDITAAGKALLDDADAAAQRTTLGAEAAGTAASTISAHEAAADPHPGYALEDDLGGAALLDVGTTAGTVAAGDDSRLTTDLGYTASTRVLSSSTGADVTLPLFTSTDAGLTPLSGGGTTNFLRADGTWAAPASGGTPGGTTGQLQWNSAGSFAGVGGSTVGATGDITLSLNGTASTPPFRLTGTWFTGGTTTTTKPHFLIEPAGTTSTAWDTRGTGLGINAPSGFPGNLLDLQVNGTSRFRVEANNQRILANAFYYDTSLGYYLNDGVNGIYNASGPKLISNAGVYWANSLNANSGTADLALARDSASVLKITDGSTGTGYFKQTPVAVSALPAAATVGAGTRGFVSDSTVAASGNFGATVTGGGSNNVPVFSDGTNWLIG